MGRIKIKPKICAYCGFSKPIFRNVARKGPQCLDCYKKDKMSSKNYKKSERKQKLKKILNSAPNKIPDYIKEADKQTSKLVRLMHVNEHGVIICCTCDKPMTFNEAQCGHYISRSEHGTRWLLDNLRPQCDLCNKKHEEDPSIFKERLEREIPGITEQLQALAREVVKTTKSDIIDLIKDYKKRIKDLS